MANQTGLPLLVELNLISLLPKVCLSSLIVTFISKDPNSLCNVIMIEKETGNLHYSVTLHGGTFAMSTRR